MFCCGQTPADIILDYYNRAKTYPQPLERFVSLCRSTFAINAGAPAAIEISINASLLVDHGRFPTKTEWYDTVLTRGGIVLVPVSNENEGKRARFQRANFFFVRQKTFET
jgi:hypothetical protein